MTTQEYEKINKILEQVYREVDKELGDFDKESLEYNQLILKVKEATLQKLGYTLDDYDNVEEKSSKQKIYKISKEKPIEENTFSAEDISLMVEIAAKKAVKNTPPKVINKITNKIVKETTIKQPIKETVIHKEDYDPSAIFAEIGYLNDRLDKIKIPEPINIELLKQEVRQFYADDFADNLEKNIDILGMPDWRKAIMGLQQQISSLGTGGGTSVLTDSHIFVGNSSNVATDVALTLSATGGAFSLANTGVLTMPNADGSTRGLLTSADWTNFNNKFSLPSLTAGSVLFSNGTTIAQDNANFFWDDTNNRLGLGINSSLTHRLHIVDSQNTTTGIKIENPNTGTSSSAGLTLLSNNALPSYIVSIGSTHPLFPNELFFENDAAGKFRFYSATDTVAYMDGSNHNFYQYFDSSKYLKTNIGAGGFVTHESTGTFPGFSFNSNVGIGTNVIDYRLNIKQDANTGTGMRLENANNGNASWTGIEFIPGSGAYSYFIVTSGTHASFPNEFFYQNSAAGKFRFYSTSNSVAYFNGGGVFSYYYDNSNLFSNTVSSTGAVTMQATGSNRTFIINNTLGTANGLRIDSVASTASTASGLTINSPSGSNHLSFEQSGTQKWIQYLDTNDIIWYASGGAGASWKALHSNGHILIGGTTDLSKLTVYDTTSSQASLCYDASNRMDITVNSTGSASFNLSGTNPAFTFLFRTNITPGTLGSGYNALNVTATLSSTNAVQIGSIFDFTTAGSGGGAIQVGLLFNLNAGYTGSNTTVGASYVNAVAGTGNNLNITAAVTAPTGNAGAVYYATATTTGLNYGTFGDAENGNLNIGLIGRAVIAKNSATNIGVLGVGLNTGTTPIQVGGYFGLHNATPTFESSALIADNGGTTSPIFLARDGGTTVFSVIDGGNTGVGITNPFGKLQVVGNGQGLYISFDNSVQASSYYTTIIPAWLSGSDSQTIHSINRIAGNTPTDMMWVGFYNSEVGVGINTATHNSTLQVEGSLSLSYVAKTSTYTATSADHTIDCTSGTFTVNLPTAVGIKGRIYVIKNTGTGVITVDGNSTETIDGATTQTLSVQYQSITIQSDNANWIII